MVRKPGKSEVNINLNNFSSFLTSTLSKILTCILAKVSKSTELNKNLGFIYYHESIHFKQCVS